MTKKAITLCPKQIAAEDIIKARQILSLFIREVLAFFSGGTQLRHFLLEFEVVRVANHDKVDLSPLEVLPHCVRQRFHLLLDPCLICFQHGLGVT